MSKVRRLYVEKKPGFNIEAQHMLSDFRENLQLASLEEVRLLNRYDVQGLSDEQYKQAVEQVFSEPPADFVYQENLELDTPYVFAVEYLPGQYDQRADSASQCVQLLTLVERPLIQVARVYALYGKLSPDQLQAAKDYIINAVDSREARLDKPEKLETEAVIPSDVAIVKGFIHYGDAELEKMHGEFAFAMSLEDLKFCRDYFAGEKRDPTVTELRVVDTYWSDHCRHTTFLTKIDSIRFEEGPFKETVEAAWQEYLAVRGEVYQETTKPITLMDIATIGAKALKKRGLLENLDSSDEINACSIKVKAKVDGEEQDYIVMFKNETHNHPTEIEPFGGAATCLGGAIRDPLSGRSYVYQAMRVTGSGDPRTPTSETLPGKLPQRKITTTAAAGYSSYGNQIGLATGLVNEIYHQGFVAKRMEIGAVIGAAPKENIVRETPAKSDVILLLGGRTGRDGCGGATGSSKVHTEESILECGAEVQKGNPLTERKLQRLFRDPQFSRKVKRCNDFGAGGVCVAIGELAPGLDIDLDAVKKKYEGLDGTELAISESQERMAVVVDASDTHKILELAEKENLEVTPVAVVTDTNRLVMHWRGQKIVDISRSFLDTNGVQQNVEAIIAAAPMNEQPMKKPVEDIRAQWLATLSELNICSQRGLIERFDSTIGAGTVLMPFGGRLQSTPTQAMAALIPVLKGQSGTATLMAYGYNPDTAFWSPFHGAVYALVDSITKIVASGGEYNKCYLTLQEYFERLNKEPLRWGKPLAALLGALHVQLGLGIAAIGGKDSMSGTFKDLCVPPTLVSFAVTAVDAERVQSNEFKAAGNRVILLKTKLDNSLLPEMDSLKNTFKAASALLRSGKAVSASALGSGGIAAAVTKACFGNALGMKFDIIPDDLFSLSFGSMLLELKAEVTGGELPQDAVVLGSVTAERIISLPGGMHISLETAKKAWEKPLEKVFPTLTEDAGSPVSPLFTKRNRSKPVKIAKPRVILPVFPGTNCEYDSMKAFERSGAIAEAFIIRNLTAEGIDESIRALSAAIDKSQIIMIPGGFSGGDEPDGSGKFIATTFRNPTIRDAVMRLLNERDGLILGICNGFQALIKLGLVPYGEIRALKADSPTLTFNRIGRHVSCLTQTRVTSVLSPWFSLVEPGSIYTVPVSHGEGRFVASGAEIQNLFQNGQVATQYVDHNGNPSMDIPYNPNGSMYAVEGITSPDGRVLGKMCHNERAVGKYLFKNVPGEFDQKIFESGVAYYL